jgi:hypothetical protein
MPELGAPSWGLEGNTVRTADIDLEPVGDENDHPHKPRRLAVQLGTGWRRQQVAQPLESGHA